MSNPYQPPQEPSENRVVQLRAPSTYFGGLAGVLALGIVGGVVAGAIIYQTFELDTGTVVFVAPAIIWIGTLISLMSMLRGAVIEVATRLWLPLLLAIPAYILYVPVCTFSAMISTSFMGSRGYGPTFSGLILASVISFVAILLILAAIVRRSFKYPVTRPDAEINATHPSDFHAPFDEPSNE